VVNPWEVIEEYGEDAGRLYLLGQRQVWQTKRFDRRQVPEITGGFLNALRSTYEFFRRYAQGWTPPTEVATTPFEKRPPADRWLLARLDEVVGEVRRSWSDCDVTAGVRGIMDFVGEDLSRWYVRRNRPRFWAPDRATDAVALETLHEVLVTSARLLAPAAPFLSDWIHRALVAASVHLAPFPTDLGRRAPELLQALERGDPVRSGDFEFRPEDVLVTREVVSDWAVQADGPYVAAVDPRLTDDLIQEGLARELVNRVQRLRKEAGYEYTTRIELSVAGAQEIVAAVSAFQGFVEGETLARKLVLGAVLDEAE